MKITYNNQTIDFFNFTPMYNQVLLALSGGVDSAALMYLVCKYFPDVELIPFHCRDDEAYPYDSNAAKNVYEFIKCTFPNQLMHDLYMFDYKIYDVSWLPYARKAAQDDSIFYGQDDVEIANTLQMDYIAHKMMNQFPYALRCDANIQDSWKQVFHAKSIPLFSFIDDKTKKIKNVMGSSGKLYHPFANVDKKFIADIYFKNNIMDDLYPLTRSCSKSYCSLDKNTECGNCLQCIEKNWAFEDLNK